MGMRERAESCPPLSPILREVDLVLVLLLFLNLIFLYFDLIFLYFVLSYFCIFFVLCTFCTFVLLSFLYFKYLYFLHFLQFCFCVVLFCCCIRTLPRGGMYWKIHSPRPNRFPKSGDFAPRGPRDCPRAKPEGNTFNLILQAVHKHN